MSLQNVTDDQIMEFTGTRDNPTTAQYERILQKRQTDALVGVKDKLVGLMETVYRASQGVQEKADKLSDTIAKASGALQEKADRLAAQNQRISESQGRQQTAIVLLTAVIGTATVAYTWITWESVQAMRQANVIQERLVDSQAREHAQQPSAVNQAAKPSVLPHK